MSRKVFTVGLTRLEAEEVFKTLGSAYVEALPRSRRRRADAVRWRLYRMLTAHDATVARTRREDT